MSFAQKYHAWILGIFSRYLGKSVAEVGAGSGNFSSLLLEEPIEELVAVEPSEMFDALQGRHGRTPRVRLERGFFSNIADAYAGHFDSVVYVNVLEHIEDDGAEMAKAKEALKVGGHICIFVPALQWLYSDFDKSVGHYRRYHKRELKKKLTEAGYEIVHVRYFDIAGILPWFVFFTLMGRKLGGGSVRTYDSIVVPVMRVVEALLPVPVGKNLIAIARKPAPKR